jgi:phosphate transport system permease protein
LKAKSLPFRKAKEKLMVVAFVACIGIALGSLGVLLYTIVSEATPFLSAKLFTEYADYRNNHAHEAGYKAAIFGTLWVVGLAMALSLPLGIAAGVYLEEYAATSRIARVLQAGVSNLAGVPSVVFGLLGLAVFVRTFGLGPVVLAGALTLTMLVFPYVVITSQEAIRAVPRGIRDAALALGATKWQSIKGQVLPAAGPGLMTGIIIAASRAIGETAPLIVIGSVILQTFLPWGPDSPFVALPVQIYAYIGLPGRDFQGVAAAGMVILLGMLFLLNSIAIVARNRLQRHRW